MTRVPAGDAPVADPNANVLPPLLVHLPDPHQVEQPIIWQMSRKFPDVVFDIRQASVQHEIGIMAVLLSGNQATSMLLSSFCAQRGHGRADREERGGRLGRLAAAAQLNARTLSPRELGPCSRTL
jgi:hypothetical protein